jgi:hypothetical protein
VLTGIAATVLVVAAAFGISALFDAATYSSWVGLAWMAATPAQVVMALIWRFEQPRALGALPQPIKGVAFTLLTGAVAAGVMAAIVLGPPGLGVMPPPPMTIMFTILSIIVTLWWVIAWGAWPLSAFKLPPLLLGLGVLVLVYPIAYGLFRLLFDFGFMEGAPVYVAGLDPHGRFMAWDVLSFGITTVACLLFTVMFDFWPIRHLPGGGAQPMQGVYATLYCGALAFGVFTLFTSYLGLDKVNYMVRAPVAYIFGFFLVNNMMQGRLLANAPQPLKGLILAALAAGAAFGMGVLYRCAAPIVAQTALAAGPPAYQLELWVATAMLGVTFPLIIAYSGSLEFWPFARRRT